MSTSPLLIERRDGGVVLLTLNRPEARNALDGEDLYAAFEDAAAQLNADLDVGCVILTGAGSAFCAGGNVKDMRARTGMFGGRADQVARNYRNGIQRIPLALWSIEAPVIAAVNGPAIGAGCDLALFCDVRLASSEAVFAESFVKLGMIAGDGGGWILPRLVGPQVASVLALSGETISAEEARACGLVWRVSPPASLIEDALVLARSIAANPSQAVRWTKRMMRDQQSMSLASFLDHASHVQAIAHHTPEHPQAVARAFAKR